MSLSFTPMNEADFAIFWPTFQAIIQAEDTYAFNPDMSLDEAYQLWCKTPLASFAVKDSAGTLLGSYYLKANAAGPGQHVCNCGYMVASAARGHGVARSMCEHSQRIGRELGFEAMQFNSVVTTNTVAVALWKRLGFEVVGTVPKAFRHAQHGLVDTYIMHKLL